MSTSSELDRALILDWRDKARLDLVRSLNARVSGFDSEIDALVEGMTGMDTVRRSRFHNKYVAPVVEEWLRELMDEFRQEIETSAGNSEVALGHDADAHSLSLGEVLGSGATVALTLAPLGVVPFAAGIATVTTTSFLVFSTSAISLPILSVVVGGALLAGAGGDRVRRRVFGKIRRTYGAQVKRNVRIKAIGDPANPGAPSVCRNLLAGIDVIANKRLENLP